MGIILYPLYEKGRPGNRKACLIRYAGARAAVCQRDGVSMKQQKLYHGACFYPELWNEAVLEEDIHMMKETGINVVRIGEFAWSKMEPGALFRKVGIIVYIF